MVTTIATDNTFNKETTPTAPPSSAMTEVDTVFTGSHATPNQQLPGVPAGIQHPSPTPPHAVGRPRGPPTTDLGGGKIHGTRPPTTLGKHASSHGHGGERHRRMTRDATLVAAHTHPAGPASAYPEGGRRVRRPRQGSDGDWDPSRDIESAPPPPSSDPRRLRRQGLKPRRDEELAGRLPAATRLNRPRGHPSGTTRGTGGSSVRFPLI